MKDDDVLSLNRPESELTEHPGYLWRDKWTALSGPLSPREALVVGAWGIVRWRVWGMGFRGSGLGVGVWAESGHREVSGEQRSREERRVYRGTLLMRNHPSPPRTLQ